MKLRILILGASVVAAIQCQAKSNPPIFVSRNFDPALVERIDVFVMDPSNNVAKIEVTPELTGSLWLV